jgi:putative ABC transport system ATP-binding protein
VITLDRVGKTYPGGVTALRDVSLTIERGELVGVVGPSGSGKSTMLHLIGALDLPTSGSVTIAGHDLSQLSDRRLSLLRGRSIGFVFQQYHLAPGVPALDNVADGLLYAGVGSRERRRRAELALCRVGLAHRVTNRPHQLSGGEKQRVAIARAVVGDPSVVLADEPTGSLDSATGQSVARLLTEAAHEQGTAVLLVTHDPAVARHAQRVVTLRSGRVK